MLLVLTACGDSRSSVEKYVAQVKRAPSTGVEKIPAPLVVKQEDYNAENLRSPFSVSNVPSQAVQAAPTTKQQAGITQAPRPDANRPREYLEQFALTSLTMVGTLSKPEMNWGLIMDSKGMVHAVKVGDYVGQNSGKIIAVTPNEIRVTEVVPNGSGGWMQTRAALTMQNQTTAPVLEPVSAPAAPAARTPVPAATASPQQQLQSALKGGRRNDR